MRKILMSALVLLLTIPAFSQHLLELKANKRKVIKVYQENRMSVYYSDWPDTTKVYVKAVLHSDIIKLTPIPLSQVDSIFAVVSAEHDRRTEEDAMRVQMKKLKKYKPYVAPKFISAFSSNRLHYGASIEGGIESKNKYRVGFGCGFEKTNQGRGFIYTTQVPVFFVFNYTLLQFGIEKQVYALASVGYNFVLNGKFSKSRDRNEGDVYFDYKDEQLSNNMPVVVGIGACLKEKFMLELSYKNQSTNVTYPVDERVGLVGINLGFKF